MAIKEVLNQGELLNEEQQENVAGGMEANTNNALACECSGTGDNNNTGIYCSCDDDQNPPSGE